MTTLSGFFLGKMSLCLLSVLLSLPSLPSSLPSCRHHAATAAAALLLRCHCRQCRAATAAAARLLPSCHRHCRCHCPCRRRRRHRRRRRRCCRCCCRRHHRRRRHLCFHHRCCHCHCCCFSCCCRCCIYLIVECCLCVYHCWCHQYLCCHHGSAWWQLGGGGSGCTRCHQAAAAKLPLPPLPCFHQAAIATAATTMLPLCFPPCCCRC